DVEQWRHLGPRMHHAVQGDARSGERDSQVARPVHGIAALDHGAPQEERRGDPRLRGRQVGADRVHDSPRTYASTVPAQPILSSPWRSAYRTMLLRTDGPLQPQAQGLKSSEILSPVMTPP